MATTTTTTTTTTIVSDPTVLPSAPVVPSVKSRGTTSQPRFNWGPAPVGSKFEQCDLPASLIHTACLIITSLHPSSFLNQASPPSTCNAPLAPLPHVVHSLLARSRATEQTFNLTLLYLLRIRPRTFNAPVASPLRCPRRCFLACLVLATKYLQDRSQNLTAWAAVSGLTVSEIARCERSILEALKWEMGVPAGIWEAWRVAVGRRAERVRIGWEEKERRDVVEAWLRGCAEGSGETVAKVVDTPEEKVEAPPTPPQEFACPPARTFSLRKRSHYSAFEHPLVVDVGARRAMVGGCLPSPVSIVFEGTKSPTPASCVSAKRRCMGIDFLVQ
ncbi:hypothetical protein HKX48_003443 [Thoreauomyces humboldtii]|nr:hypothetical protein HKX48_003443 [Thoreauomyces humboldtii]